VVLVELGSGGERIVLNFGLALFIDPPKFSKFSPATLKMKKKPCRRQFKENFDISFIFLSKIIIQNKFAENFLNFFSLNSSRI